MDTQLYLRVRGRVLGPYDQEKLQSLVRRGQLSRMHEVSTDGAQWVRASTYSELFAGAPVKLATPEMQIPAPPPAQQPASDLSIPFAEDAVLQTPASPKTAPSAATGWGWYYKDLGAEHGPVDESVLRQKLVSGQLGSETLVWNDSMTQWTAASQTPGLIPLPAKNRGTHGGRQRPQGSEDDMEGLYRAARASRPWALLLAITAFVYAGLCILLGFWVLVKGAEKGFPPLVAMGLFEIVSGVVAAAGGILLLSYASRLASLAYSHACKVLESAMDRLKTFWIFVSFVMIVSLAFIGFFAVWIFAIDASLARFM